MGNKVDEPSRKKQPADAAATGPGGQEEEEEGEEEEGGRKRSRAETHWKTIHATQKREEE